MDKSIYDRARLPMTEVLARYGITPNRGGYICCPFHTERTPSCKIYHDSFYCFGCGTGGDAVSFVALYEHISPHEAAVRLVGEDAKPVKLSDRRRAVEQRQQQKDSQKYISRMQLRLIQLFRVLNAATRGHPPGDEPDGLWLIALHSLDRVDFLLDESDRLEFTDFDAIYGKEVRALERIVFGTDVF